LLIPDKRGATLIQENPMLKQAVRQALEPVANRRLRRLRLATWPDRVHQFGPEKFLADVLAECSIRFELGFVEQLVGRALVRERRVLGAVLST
jgi:hypothetical protein